ncbi:hypothetical protein ACSFE6_04820 [Pseudomonas baetica]|uniref:hypothetical protein n=1 Tax=Pseudomonas baetica TaxID=674054 RepID=UPI003EE8E3C1
MNYPATTTQKTTFPHFAFEPMPFNATAVYLSNRFGPDVLANSPMVQHVQMCVSHGYTEGMTDREVLSIWGYSPLPN